MSGHKSVNMPHTQAAVKAIPMSNADGVAPIPDTARRTL
jgi:hypothetical protein